MDAPPSSIALKAEKARACCMLLFSELQRRERAAEPQRPGLWETMGSRARALTLFPGRKEEGQVTRSGFDR